MTDQKQNEINSIKASRENSNAAILKGDAAGVAQYWMDDIIVISGEGGQYAGKKLLLKVFTEMFQEERPVFERIPSLITIGDSGVLAWETGEWNYKTEKFRGNYSAVWRKIKGKWLTRSELFVSLD